MKKPAFLAALLLLGHIFIAAQTPEKPTALTLHFETNLSELTDQHRAELSNVLQTLPGKPSDYSITVTGHTDARGSDTYNQELSLRRGQSVAGFLTARGFAGEKIALAAQGEHHPAAGNDSDRGMLLNRRVEVRFERTATFSNRPADLVPEMKVRFQADRGITFASPISGSRVQIPGGILVYPDGAPVQGEVELRYREWRNLYDYLSFGLPMHYGDDRGNFFFNSNGMFEVQAYQKNQALGVAKGESFTVTFVPTKEMPDVNLYRFDAQAGQWTVAAEKGKSPAAQPAALTAQAVEATNNGLGRPKCSPNPLRFPKNVRPAELLAAAVQTGYELATGVRRFPIAYLQDPLQDDTALVRQSERTQIQLHQYDDVKSYFFIDDLQQEFTELSVLKDYKWEYVPSLVEGEFTAEHLKMQWYAAYLSYDEGNNLYDVLLASPALQLNIKARLLHADGRIVTREENPVLNAQYKTLQKERWDKKLENYSALRQFIALSMPLRDEDEWCMGTTEWLKYFNANKKKMVERYTRHRAADYGANPDAGNQLIQDYNVRCRAANLAEIQARNASRPAGSSLAMTLQVFDFGIYNCDQIYRLGAGTQVLAATFRTRDGKSIAPRQTNVVEKNSLMMLSAPSPNQVYYSPEKTFDVIVMGDDGRTYLLRDSEFAALDLAGRSTADLVLDDVTDLVKTPKDWMKVLGI